VIPEPEPPALAEIVTRERLVEALGELRHVAEALTRYQQAAPDPHRAILLAAVAGAIRAIEAVPSQVIQPPPLDARARPDPL